MCLMRRIDRICTFIQLLAGGATFADWLPVELTGGIVAVLACIQLTWSPAIKSIEAKYHQKTYIDLRSQIGVTPDTGMAEKIASLESSDSEVLGILCDPAWVAACLQLGLHVPEKNWEMGCFQKIIAHIAGHMPKRLM